MRRYELPEVFKGRYAPLVEEPEVFLACMLEKPAGSFRVNTSRFTPERMIERCEDYGVPITQMKWYDAAFQIGEGSLGRSIENLTGSIYIQSLPSMLPPLAVRDELERAERVLDGCAAPGSKTTLLSLLMKNRGFILANDIHWKRIRPLKGNLEKLGIINVTLTNQDLTRFPHLWDFDVVLVDAPCSSEGTIRKNWKGLRRWSKRHIDKHARLQKQLILRAYEILRAGGVMVYSTCTFAPEENEGVVTYLLEKEPGATLEPLDFPGFETRPGLESFGAETFDPELRKAIRVWPHLNDTEGFFVARIRKEET